ncbi:NAD(P)H-dependent oxidoreductase [Aeribacillus pallidus]|uniref:NADPH-dependent FMN reductase n=1 Tax=Aeribacillus TaxID=1055323 RepID=UPI0007B48D3A|nr:MULTISPECIES: NAD(P)H-dependent oxidoreductase [Aeribacillus]KZM54469.1 NADH-dependent FMN reductase [Aeribacillus pallidus]MDR9797635.1 NAD(P)H-dependent oxidoreductase [Aeribacillus pallidus]MED0652310.1 NAD(P)H-dependent oxidoreductase [Aeribacillus composti]MED4488491.1 NAD(P)H-dependent oxidoreductase [Aeribacillus pallidus]
MKLLGISGTITGSKTRIVVAKVLEEVKRYHPEVDIELLDMKNYDVQFCDGRDPSTYTGDTKKVIDIVSLADFYIIGTPIFQGSITGVLKNLFDLVPPQALRNKVMGFVATGGTYQHYLVIENQLKPIAGYFRAFVSPNYVYVHNDHFSPQNELIDQEVLDRIRKLAKEVVYMQMSLKENKI